MALIKSISGIRGTIGGKEDTGLTPIDIVNYTASFAHILKKERAIDSNTIVVGRDGRISGAMVQSLVVATLQGMGMDVIDLGISTTPTVEMAVPNNKALGGIILTASHNPKEWNALKLLNHAGEFISAETGAALLTVAQNKEVEFADVNKLGNVLIDLNAGSAHIQAILNHPLVDTEAIKAKNFKIVVDAINSSGAIYVPQLLQALGVTDYLVINHEVNGRFAHNPEPLPENLRELCSVVEKQNAHLGIAVDPDVDRLCFVNEDGSLFGEEYTLVAVADYILSHQKGNTVSNLSSTRALKDVTEKHGGTYYASAVGEVNVVKKMKEVNAVIGGEGNGGIIDPQLHYGRDALVGIALFLTHLAKSGKTCSGLRKTYPEYTISKNKIELSEKIDIAYIFEEIKNRYSKNPINTEDGLKIEFDKDWVHLRTSNTEPIIRIYAESNSVTTADNIAKKLIQDINEIIKSKN